MIVDTALFIRHGETAYNRQRRLQGSLPVPLNDCGRRQAAKLTQYLKKVPIDAIYASPRARAWQTADIIGVALALPIVPDERLAEINFGDFEGHTFAEVAERFPAAYRKWETGFRAYRVPGGESRLDVQRRMQAAWDDIIRSEHQTVAIVGHSSAQTILLASLFTHLPDQRIANTSITTLRRHDDIWEIASYADTPHLDD